MMMSLGRKLFVLQILQLATLALPVVAQALLARSLGPHAYGRLAFVIALAAYWTLFCDFGFGWSATRLVAVHHADVRKRSEIVSTTLLAKLALFGIGAGLVLLLTTTVLEFRSETPLIAASCFIVLGTVLSPLWYFQGTERIHVPLCVEAVWRALAIPVLVATVASPDDLVTAIWVLALTQLASGATSLLLLFRESELRWTKPTFAELTATLRKGAPLFLSSSAISLYTASSTLILGFTSTREQVGYFGLAQRLVAAACSILTPLNQLLYPQASRLIQSGAREAANMIKRALTIQTAVGLALTVAVFAAGPKLLLALFGPSYSGALTSLNWLAPLPLVIGIGGVFANLVMLPAGKDSQHLLMTSVAGALNVVLLFLLADSGAVGAAMALLCAECFVAFYAIMIGARLTKGLARPLPTVLGG